MGHKAFIIILVCFKFVHNVYLLPIDNEPKCYSRFDFEEKFMEKVIRMELTFDSVRNRLEGNLVKAEDKIAQLTSDSEAFKEKMEALVQDKMGDIATTFMSTKLEMDEEIRSFKSNATNLLQEFKDAAINPEVMFHVRDVKQQPTANAIIKFSKVVSNTNNVFNMDTGIFTAPIKGTYWFSVQLCTNTNKYFTTTLYVNEEPINRVFMGDSLSATCSTFNIVVILQHNDKACVKAGHDIPSDTIHVSPSYMFSSFMGTLVH